MTQTPQDAMRAAKMLIGSIQWSEEGGTEVTAWGCCPVCGGADWTGHAENCTVLVVLNQLDEAILALDSQGK